MRFDVAIIELISNQLFSEIRKRAPDLIYVLRVYNYTCMFIKKKRKKTHNLKAIFKAKGNSLGGEYVIGDEV